MMIDTKGCLTIIGGILLVGFALYAIGSLIAGWLQ